MERQKRTCCIEIDIDGLIEKYETVLLTHWAIDIYTYMDTGYIQHTLRTAYKKNMHTIRVVLTNWYVLLCLGPFY